VHVILGVDWSADMAATFGDDFRDATIVRQVSRTRDSNQLSGPATITTSEHTCKVLALGYARRFIDGSSVRAGDMAAIILRGTLDPATVPAPGDTITCFTPAGASTVTATVIAIESITEAFITAQIRGAGV
jgi:hypothetical protein